MDDKCSICSRLLTEVTITIYIKYNSKNDLYSLTHRSRSFSNKSLKNIFEHRGLDISQIVDAEKAARLLFDEWIVYKLKTGRLVCREQCTKQ